MTKKHKRFTIILVMLIGGVLWFSRSLWINFVVNQFPTIEKSADLIQTIESIINVIVLIINGLLVYLLWLSKDEREPDMQIANANLLENVTVNDIRGMLGQGGKVNWIDRNDTSVGDIRKNGRVIITGRSRQGKTREAAELIRRAIDEDLISEERTFKIGTAFRFLDVDNLTNALIANLDYDVPILIFIDNLPFHYYGRDLDKLSLLLGTLNKCKEAYVIAVGRSDQITNEHHSWLIKEQFYEIELLDLNHTQVGRLIDSTAGILKLQIDDSARNKLIESSQGRPELPLMVLRRIIVDGITQINKEIATHYSRESITEVWSETKRYIIGRNPTSKYILCALADFYSANITPYRTVIVDYVRFLLRKSNKLFWQKQKNINDALDYLYHFDIIVQNNIISHSDVVVEGVLDKSTAFDNLLPFFDKFKHRYNIWNTRRQNNEKLFSATLLELALSFQKNNRNIVATRLYSYALQLTPHPTIFNLRGIAYRARGQNWFAIDDYNKAIKLEPNNALAYLSRGLANYEVGDFLSAEMDYNLTIQIAGQDSIRATAYAERGEIKRRRGDISSAMGDYNKAVLLSASDASILHKRGNALYDHGDLYESIRDYTRAIELIPDSPDKGILYKRRGDAYHEIGDLDAAISDQNMAIQLDMNNEYAKGNLLLAREAKEGISNFEQNLDIILGDLYKALKKSVPDNAPLINLSRTRLSPLNAFLKTTLDLLFVIPGVILLTPFILLIGILIRYDTTGPILYKRRILGIRGKIIGAYKFRTMHDYSKEKETHPELEALLKVSSKVKNDPRVTRLGNFLRRLNLDELPQLFNVLNGSMSLVGPRMITEHEAELFGSDLGLILSVKPGLTGLWQVSGRSDISFEERIHLDKAYIQNYSIWLDLLILMRTIPAVILGRGAY